MKRKLKSALSLLLCMIMVFGAVAVGGEGFADVLDAFSVKSSAVTTYSSGDYEYTLNQFNKATLTKFTGKKTSTISIPTTIDEYEVSALGESLYKGYNALTSVDIPSNIKSIYPNAFNGCTSLNSVKLNDGLEVIGYSAFTGTAITEITIPKTVCMMSFIKYSNDDETMADYMGGYSSTAGAFCGANKLKKVVFADGVTKIGDCSLYNCKYLTEVIIPDTVKSIGSYAFAGCTGLKNIVLTEAVDRINTGVFSNCTGLTSIEIPSHIKAIYPEAFKGCTSLSSVKLNDGLEVIGYSAFTGTAITEITIPKTVCMMSFIKYSNDDETMADYMGGYSSTAGAFCGANKLKKVVFADGVTKIGDCSLYNCKYLTEVIIPDTVKSIRGYAFAGCTGLTSIDIPGNIKSIYPYAFNGCTSLSSVKLNDGLEVIGYSAFTGTAITEITIPKTVCMMSFIKYSNDDETMADYMGGYSSTAGAFCGANKLKKVVFADGVTKIGDCSLYNCKYLTEVIIPDTVKSIGSYAFAGCTGLKNIVLTEAVDRINTGVFSNCTGLTSIEIPSHIKAIYPEAFKGCTSLSSVKLNDGLEVIGYSAFTGTAITEITIPKTVCMMSFIKYSNDDETMADYMGGYSSTAGAFCGANKLKKVVFADGVTKIGDCSLYNCKYLTEVIIPDTVKSIRGYAFAGCTGLTSIDIPGNIKSIYPYAFNGCTSLSSVKLNDGLEVIGYSAFTGTAITEITIPKTVCMMSFIKYSNDDETMADYMGGYSSTAGAFCGANKLKKVVFADGVTKIGDCSLYNCKYLTEVIIPDTVKSIGSYAFAGCTGLKNIVLTEAVDRINTGVFSNCTGLTSIEIPSHIKAIYPEAFKGCTSLSSVKLNDGLEVIGYSAFTGTAITEITIPKTVCMMSFIKYSNDDETMADYMGGYSSTAGAFCGANKLKKVVFADGVTKIGDCSLYNCKYLTEVIIPDTVKSIGSYAFAGCTGLTELSIPNSVSSIGSKAFNGIDPFVINVSLNSAAAIYAIDNGIMFNAIDDEFTDSNDLFLNRSGSSYISETTGKVSTSGTANLQVNYSFKKSKANYASNIKIKIKIPADTELVANTLRDINNNPIEVNEKDGVITVPVTQKSGTIKFSVLPTGITDLLSYATIEYTYNNVKKSEIIGILSEEIAILTLDAQDVVTSDSVTVKGIAPPETDVTLYVDNKIVKSVKTNKAGNYMTDISLGNAIDGRDYIITAKCQDYGSTVDFTVTHKEKAPELKTIDLYYNGSETPVTIYPESNITPYVSFAPGKPFTFKAEIDNPEEVDKVYVTSTRNGVVKSIEANYDKSTNQFVATGYFDEENHSYVPGKIGVEYKLKHEDVKISADVDFKSMYNNMPNEAKDAEVKVISSTANSQVAEIDVSQLIGTAQKTLVKVAINEYEGATGTKYLSETYGLLSEVDGWIKTVAEGKDGKEYQFFRKDSTVGERAEGLVYIVKDVTDSKIIEMMIGASETPQNAMKISDISAMLTKAGTYADFAKLYFKTMEIKKERAELDDKIRSTVPVNKQAEALRKSALLENDKTDFLLLTTLLPLTLTAMGVATGPAGIIFTGLLGAMTATSSFFWNFRTSNILGGTGNIKFAVDPSGFVYEGSEENRIENVIATAYWIESDGSDTFFQNKPSSSTYGTKWNAGEYSQANPLLTDIDGKYAWDVPEGWWRVKYEKDGYETVWSDWMPVPPPQTDVNICMTKLNDPNKEYTVTWSIDGEKTTAKYKAGDSIVKPADPIKEGYTFKGWTPSVPATMPAYDIIFTAVFEKSTVPTGAKISIKNPSTTTVSYGFTLNLHANVTDLPDGARIVWSMDGSGFELIPSADGMTCGVKSVSKGSATITAKVIDKNGNAVKDANGNEITASQQLTSKAGFFQKLVAFFKKLFGSNMVIPSSLNKLVK